MYTYRSIMSTYEWKMWIRHPCLSKALQRFLVELLFCFRLMNFHGLVQDWSEEASCSTVTQSKKSQREPLLVDDWFFWNPLWGLGCLLEGLFKNKIWITIFKQISWKRLQSHYLKGKPSQNAPFQKKTGDVLKSCTSSNLCVIPLFTRVIHSRWCRTVWHLHFLAAMAVSHRVSSGGCGHEFPQ